jgi:carbonic anhydrase
MSAADELLANAERYAGCFDKGGLPLEPARRIAVLACMDSRFIVERVLGLQEGEAHIIRNAGGVASDDAIRSLAVSQRLGGTEEIVLIQHTDCGMAKVSDREFRRQIRDETGVEPDWPVHAFAGTDEDVRASVARIRRSPFIPRTQSVRGFVYDVLSGVLREVR